MSRPVPDDPAVLMLDGVQIAEHTCVVALGIRADGSKLALGTWEGATENKAVCARGLGDLAARGLRADDGLLVVIDGSKALRAACVTPSASEWRSSAVASTSSATSSATCPSASDRG
jgi:putative transposase